MIRWFLITTSFFLFCFSGWGQSPSFPDLRFTSLTTKDGLSSNSILCIFKDSRGFMWIGTDNGLNCYDGRHIRVYQHHAADSNSLPDNSILAIVADASGNFWISTANGLAYFNPMTGQSKNYFHEEGNANSLSNDYRPIPFLDSYGKLWLATSDGVQLFQPQKKLFTTLRLPIPDLAGQKKHNNQFGVFLEDGRHRLWVTNYYGFHEIDRQKLSFTSYVTGYPGLSLFIDQQQQFWIGQWGDHLLQFDPVEKKYTPHFGNHIVFAIQEWIDLYQTKWLCLGTDAGLTLYSPATRQYRQYQSDDKNEYSLRGQIINCIYKDEMNRLWLGTTKGLNILDPYLQHYQNYWLSESTDKNRNTGIGLVRCLYEEENLYQVGAWHRRGLYSYDKNWNKLLHQYIMPPGMASEDHKSIYSIDKDEEGSAWYSTDSGIIKKSLNRLTVYVPPDAVSVERGDFKLREMIHRQDGLYWVRTVSSGMYVFDKKEGRFVKHYRPQKEKINSLPDANIYVAKYDNRQQLWIGTEKGLYRYNKNTDDFTGFYFRYMNLRDEAMLNRINDIAAGEKGFIWVATENGLVKFNPENGKYEVLDKSMGLPGEKPGKILVDKNEIIWMTSREGLIAYDDTKKSFRLFTAAYGVPVENYDPNAVFTFNSRGNILVGGIDVVTEFNPYTLPAVTLPPLVEIAVVQALGRPIVYSIKGMHQKQINLPAGSNQLSVQFSVLNYTSPLQNKFYYRLDGTGKGWTESEDGSVNFTNLKAGEHTLRVKGSNNDGVMNETGDELYIMIAPYFWQTNGFKIVAGLLFAAGCWFLIRRRFKAIRHEAELKHKIAETEMQALRAQMNPHFIFNCINSIDALIQSNDKYQATLYLNKFAKLIRNILDSSKQNTVTLAKDLDTLKLYIELEQLRHENKFTAEIKADEALLQDDYKVPPLIIQPFVENAILHGIRYRQDNNGKLSISVIKQDGYLQYIIEDNGVGRNTFNGQLQKEKLSYGIDMSNDRVKLFNNEEKASVQITDLLDNDKLAGTKVEVLLKIQ